MLLRLLLLGFLVLSLPSAPARGDQLRGVPIREVHIQNQNPQDEQRLLELLAVQPNDVYRLEQVRQSIESLYATGRFYDIQVDAERRGDGVTLTFITKENYFIGGVDVEGVPEPPTHGHLVSATKLELGTLWTDEKEARAIEGLKRLLEENGLYQAKIRMEPRLHPDTQQVGLRFIVDPGERARIAGIRVTGAPVFSLEQVRRESKLKEGKKVTAQALQNGLTRLRKYYQKKQYLEASVGIAERQYLPDQNQVVVVLEVTAGSQVEVKIQGAKLSGGKKRELLPVYDEGRVDADLVREGANNIRDYYQRRGRFEAEVEAHVHQEPARKHVTVEYHVNPGPGHEVEEIRIVGNKYFSTPLLRERMFITEKTFIYDGRYSRQYLERDLEAIRNLYIANGFQKVRATSEVIDNYQGKKGDLGVTVRIEEGPQTLVRNLTIEGARQIPEEQLRPLVACAPGQPYSDFNVLLDRDNLLSKYFNAGFPEVTFTSQAHPVPGREDQVDLLYKFAEGQRRYFNRVLITGPEKTRRHIVEQLVQVKAGQPLSQQDMIETQKALYDLGLFQKVDIALQNPNGQERHKNVLIHLEEARRTTIAVGGGADIARFGGDRENLSVTQGSTGFSPRVSFDVTRLNFRGLNHTVSFKSQFSTLQKRVLLSYTAPRVWNMPAFTLMFNAYLDRTFDVLTFVSRRLEGSVALQQKRSKSDTVLYRYSYRRVNVERDTLNVSVNDIPLFARPVRVGMLGATFVRDRRDDPTDSRRGAFLTVDSGISARPVGSEASFSRLVTQFTTYHRVGGNKVLARNTQFGLAEPFGRLRKVRVLNAQGVPEERFTRDIPLPERFFSGGGNAHRGFGVNQAGPRDLATGFPVGGGALLLNSLELRFPLLGPNIGAAVFHDVGNVFARLAGISIRMTQRSPGDFNYMVHALGTGLRYKTPIGPVRFDLAYSINPPSYYGLTGTRKELLNGGGRRELRRLSHIQFFFSIGQTF